MNTTGNAFHVLRMVEEERKRRGEENIRLVVVTSRYHMPRAAWLFRVMADVLETKVEVGQAPVPVGEGGDVEDPKAILMKAVVVENRKLCGLHNHILKAKVQIRSTEVTRGILKVVTK